MKINKQDIEKEREIIKDLQHQLAEKDKEIEHWHNLFKQKEQQFQSVRERYHLLNRLQANYDKKYKLHLSEMQCLELVEKNEKLEQQLAEKDKEIKEKDNHVYDLFNTTQECIAQLDGLETRQHYNIKLELLREIYDKYCRNGWK